MTHIADIFSWFLSVFGFGVVATAVASSHSTVSANGEAIDRPPVKTRVRHTAPPPASTARKVHRPRSARRRGRRNEIRSLAHMREVRRERGQNQRTGV